MKLKIKALLSGMATYIPGYQFRVATDGTDSARYCYSVWLRHLVLAHANGLMESPIRTVAELGPGDSIGIGLAALVSGVDEYFALDIVPYANTQNNLAIFEELLEMFKNREDIPGDNEFPDINPKLESYKFPHDILNEERLNTALEPLRITKIRQSIEKPNTAGSLVHYVAPWYDSKVIQDSSIDMIYSQAVLEHIDELSNTYNAMRRWLKPTGFMSHQIDYRCHGKADTWNGHWTYSDVMWKLVVGRRSYLLNREPHSTHIRLHLENEFKIVNDYHTKATSELQNNNLAYRFRNLSNDDLTISGALIQSSLSSKNH